MAILATAMANNVRIEGEWISRDLNQAADYISRITDYDDWGIIDHGIFRRLGSKWGPYTVD